MRKLWLLLILALPSLSCLLASQAALQMVPPPSTVAGGGTLAEENAFYDALLTEMHEAESSESFLFDVAYKVGDHDVHAMPHAVIRHGEIVYTARQSFGEQNPNRRRRECKETDRVIHAAKMDNGQWAIMIEGFTTARELTCFVIDASDLEHTWGRLLQMHKCGPDEAIKSWGHDFGANEAY